MELSATPALFVTPAPNEHRVHHAEAPSSHPAETEVQRPAKRAQVAGNEADDHEDSHMGSQPARTPAPVLHLANDDVIEVDRDDFEELYYLKEFQQWVPKHQVANRLRASYARIFARQAAQARPHTDLKQRMEEITSKVRDSRIPYIRARDEAIWFKILRRLCSALEKEYEEAVEIRDALARPASRAGVDAGLVAETRARCEQMEKDLGVRRKIVKEMIRWMGRIRW